MPFQEIADQEQLATLRAVLDEICIAAGIAPEAPRATTRLGCCCICTGSAAARLTS